jgi:hypothetical protein
LVFFFTTARFCTRDGVLRRTTAGRGVTVAGGGV